MLSQMDLKLVLFIHLTDVDSFLFQFSVNLRCRKPIYMRVGFVLESRFSAEMIWPISMIFGILNKEWSNFKKMLFILL